MYRSAARTLVSRWNAVRPSPKEMSWHQEADWAPASVDHRSAARSPASGEGACYCRPNPRSFA